jgi:putative peptidoglycan lipid II flippase
LQAKTRQSLVFAAGTLISRISGFARDALFAMTYGSQPFFDAFLVAFQIPNFMRRLFAEGAFSQAFVPLLTTVQTEESAQASEQAIQQAFSWLLLCTTTVVLFMLLLAPWMITLVAPGFNHDPQRLTWAIQLLHWTLPYLTLICLAAFANSILHTRQHFLLSGLLPVLLNLFLISATLFDYYHQQYSVKLAMAVSASGLCQIIILTFRLRQLNIKLGWNLQYSSFIKKLFTMMSAGLFGASLVQCSLLIDTFLASFLPQGSISWIYYAQRLIYLPLGLFAVAISTVILPQLSRSRSNPIIFKQNLDWGLKHIVYLALPSCVGLWLLAPEILATLFAHGSFTTRDLSQTCIALQMLSIGLPAFMLLKIITSAFYALHDFKTPVRATALALICNLFFNAVFFTTLQHAGLMLATSLSAWFNLGFLLRKLHQKHNVQIPWTNQVPWGSCSGSIAMALLLKQITPAIAIWMTWPIGQRFSHLFILIAAATTLYFILSLSIDKLLEKRSYSKNTHTNYDP